MSETMGTNQNKVTLKKPIEWGDETITELTFRDLSVADLKKTDRAKGDVEKTVILIAASTGVAPPAIERMGSKDFQACSEMVGRFFD